MVYSVAADKKLSTVVPANVTGEDKSHELSNMDLAVKLHYLRGLYVFEGSEAVRGLTVHDLKKPMFPLLDLYYIASGRIRRRNDTGRPFLRCNDSGIRIVEATSDRTVRELVEDLKEDYTSLQNDLVPTNVLGPDLSFSPLVFIQEHFTGFKCGGISVGLSWAHVLGDAFSASIFINTWGRILSGHVPTQPLHVSTPPKSEFPLSIPEKSITLKMVDPVGDHWLPPHCTCKMGTHTFHVTTKQLEHMAPIFISTPNPKLSQFELISAAIWKCLSRISGNKSVIICGSYFPARENEFPSNKIILGTVEVDFSISESDVLDLAMLIATKKNPENGIVEEMLEKDDGKSDFLLYGAKLTFINMLNSKIYDFDLKGDKPIFANYTVEGVGEEGAVLVLPGPRDECAVTVILPENLLVELKKELNNYWL